MDVTSLYERMDALASRLCSVNDRGCLQARPPSLQRIIDLSLAVSADSLAWGSTEGMGPDFRTLRGQRSKGDVANMSWLRMDAHTATHLDAPSHFVQVGSCRSGCNCSDSRRWYQRNHGLKTTHARNSQSSLNTSLSAHR
jgi:hypothetical protein